MKVNVFLNSWTKFPLSNRQESMALKFSLRGRRKKGRERGREKSTKEGKGKGAPAIRAGVFVIRPPFSQLIR